MTRPDRSSEIFPPCCEAFFWFLELGPKVNTSLSWIQGCGIELLASLELLPWVLAPMGLMSSNPKTKLTRRYGKLLLCTIWFTLLPYWQLLTLNIHTLLEAF